MRNLHDLLRHAAYRRLSAVWLLLSFVLIAALPAHSALAATVGGAKPTVAQPADQQSVTWPRFGVDFSSSSSATSFTDAQLAGAKTARVYLSWKNMERINTSPDNYVWSYDSTFKRLADAGLTAEVVLYQCPAWACPAAEGPINRVPLGEFAEFTAALTARYSVAPYNVHLWELFNEPDSTGRPESELNWGLHGADYTTMLGSVVPEMRRIDPQVKIALGGLAYDWFSDDPYPGPFNRNFLRDVLTAGGGQYLDYIPFHHYITNIHWTSIADKAAEIRGIAAEYGFTGPIVCNETGFSSSPDLATGRWGPNSPEIQARYLAQVFAESAANGMPATVWFSVTDSANVGPFAPFAANGLTQIDRTPKLAFYAFRTASGALGDGAFIRNMTLAETGSDDVEGHVFAGANPSDPVSVLWVRSHSTATVQLAGAYVTGITDMYGTALNVAPDATGSLLLPLDENPVYVHWSHTPRFNDVPLGFYLYDPIEFLAGHGAISGYSNGSFRPFNNATRGQVTKILALANNWTIDTTGGPHFSDVSVNNPFYPFIETAFKRNVISGYSDGTFKWGNDVTRGQLSKLIVLAQGWTPVVSVTPHFVDVQADNTFYSFIETAYAKGIISGYDLPGGGLEFRWGRNATRGQISKVIYLAVTAAPAQSAKAGEK